MPTATEFTALGAGNGFASCLSKVDVDDYDYWTTLSGVNKDSPATSDALILESLKLAMMIYWNLESISCSADAFPVDLVNGLFLDEDIQLKKPTGGAYKVDYDTYDALTPDERVCYLPQQFTLYDESNSFFRAVRALVGFKVVAMYNEGEFVGYGSGLVRPSTETPSTNTASVFAQWGGYCGVHIGGYLDELSGVSGSSLKEAYGYKTISSNSKTFYFCAAATARSSTGGNFYYDATVSINNLTARSTFRETSSNDLVSDAEVSLSDLNFYTY